MQIWPGYPDASPCLYIWPSSVCQHWWCVRGGAPKHTCGSNRRVGAAAAGGEMNGAAARWKSAEGIKANDCSRKVHAAAAAAAGNSLVGPRPRELKNARAGPKCEKIAVVGAQRGGRARGAECTGGRRTSHVTGRRCRKRGGEPGTHRERPSITTLVVCGDCEKAGNRRKQTHLQNDWDVCSIFIPQNANTIKLHTSFEGI